MTYGEAYKKLSEAARDDVFAATEVVLGCEAMTLDKGSLLYVRKGYDKSLPYWAHLSVASNEDVIRIAECLERASVPVSELLRLYRHGDHLDDEQLKRLGAAMKAANNVLNDLGELFHLQCVYAGQVAANCDKYLRSREEQRRVYYGKAVDES